uniref:Uncharacterized protein n=1 Tax=Solanum tuberosum TaxID=4113 RepID=M1DXQ7_SOLTU
MFTAGELVPAIRRKRIHTDEEEDANANEKHRIHEEEEAGQKELNQQNGNQESDKKVEETEDGKPEGFDEGEAGGNPLGRKRKRQDDENGDKEEERRQNAGSGNNVNHRNSEQNRSGNQESVGEEEERRAAEKGKQPMSCKCEAMVCEFFDFEQGESSKTNEDETHSDIDDHRDLAILRSMWNFKNINGDFPHPPSDKLLKYILLSIPKFKLIKEYLKMKIMEFESNFKDIIQMDGDNPEMNRPIDRETFHLCKLLWGNQQQRRGNPEQQLGGNQQQRLRGNLQWVLRGIQQQQLDGDFCLVYYQQGDNHSTGNKVGATETLEKNLNENQLSLTTNPTLVHIDDDGQNNAATIVTSTIDDGQQLNGTRGVELVHESNWTVVTKKKSPSIEIGSPIRNTVQPVVDSQTKNSGAQEIVSKEVMCFNTFDALTNNIVHKINSSQVNS